MYRSILVPLDGSHLSEYALPIACDIARRLGAPLQLIHVRVRARPAPIFIESPAVIDEQLQSLGSVSELGYLERICNRLAADPELFVTVAILDPLDADGHDLTIPDMLVRYAAATDTDLIVMTTHRQHTWPHGCQTAQADQGSVA